ncbi:4Fe-4S binding protein [Nanoarchaeota archaeon]
MGHVTSKSYYNLQKRLDKSPQGTPASESLFKILEILFTEKEAELVSVLPLKFFTVEKAAKIWKKPEKETMSILDGLADKGILLDLANEKTKSYVLAPPMAGFFEFSLMRTDGKFDTKVLSEIYHQYINVEDKFAKEVFGVEPMMCRTFVQEEALEPSITILDYEKATKVIDTATFITVGRCYCRHKMEHMGKACDNPQMVCLTFNRPAKSLAKHGISKKISKKEAHEILDKSIKLGLVQVGDNVQDRVGWICNCCSCCCEALLVYKRLGFMPKMNSNFYASGDKSKCTDCGICNKKCPVEAIDKSKVDYNRCIGCGVCTRFCPVNAIKMKRRKETIFVPKDVFERFLITAINEGKLQNFIFDNHQFWGYEALRRLIGIVLKLPPTKKLLAHKQLKSRYLKFISKKAGYSEDTDYSHPELDK